MGNQASINLGKYSTSIQISGGVINVAIKTEGGETICVVFDETKPVDNCGIIGRGCDGFPDSETGAKGCGGLSEKEKEDMKREIAERKDNNPSFLQRKTKMTLAQELHKEEQNYGDLSEKEKEDMQREIAERKDNNPSFLQRKTKMTLAQELHKEEQNYNELIKNAALGIIQQEEVKTEEEDHDFNLRRKVNEAVAARVLAREKRAESASSGISRALHGIPITNSNPERIIADNDAQIAEETTKNYMLSNLDIKPPEILSGAAIALSPEAQLTHAAIADNIASDMQITEDATKDYMLNAMNRTAVKTLPGGLPEGLAKGSGGLPGVKSFRSEKTDCLAKNEAKKCVTANIPAQSPENKDKK